ncbi:MAG: fructose-bisphosphate aldolase class I [Chloroflexota bacterium]|jgi:fructose-bisphosphate aldolase class I
MSTPTLDPRGIAQALVAPGKGILAADESFPTIEKRFRSVGVESTEPNRRAYRELLFSTAGLERSISGVILFDETIRQADRDGVPFPVLLESKGIIAGIKVDKGAKPLAGAPGEKVTEGLDGLRDRLAEYRELGARFTKWRAVYAIDGGTPSESCLRTNADALARFATLSQEAGLVPILEPEVLMDGSHTIECSEAISCRVWQAVFEAAFVQGVSQESMLLKTNMVLPGYDCAEQASPEHIAERTVASLSRHVPPAVPGIVFLSGGQSEETATVNLDAINRRGGHPWELSFSFGRALQASALQAWADDPGDAAAAQAKLLARAEATGAARSGTYRAASAATAGAAP